MEQMPIYANFVKDLLTKKMRIHEDKSVELEIGCSVITYKSLPRKNCDLSSFTLSVTIGSLIMAKYLLDLGVSINLMSLSMLKRFRDDIEILSTKMTL